MTKALLIAGTHSGCGKTTVALALMAALQSRGLRVQPFKVGPDFIDPGHHAAVCGRPSRNLDTWMLSEETVRATFDRADADIAVIEGAMGLFDGKGPDDLRGSSAAIARLLDVPVVLVVDAEGLAASVAAVVKGFATLDPHVRVAGVICNRIASGRHYEYLAPAIRRHTDVTPLGWLPRRPDWAIPERHLGLTTTEDLGESAGRWQSLGRSLAETVEIDRLLELASCLSPLSLPGERGGGEGTAFASVAPSALTPLLKYRYLGGEGDRIGSRVAVARDAAFCFYYPENLELLAEAGGEIVPFSPLADSVLPDGTGLLYLGGGYPELHAARLAENVSMRDSIRRFHANGGTIYAECGGLMYVCRELVDLRGRTYPMLDLLPARTVMQSRRAALGYVTLRTLRDSPLGAAGTVARGHEFHYSRLEPLGPLTYAGELDDGRGPRPDGLVAGSLWAGYAHLHFGSNPALAASLLGRAGAFFLP